MATQFAMPVPATIYQPYTLYNQQQTSPLSSAHATPSQHSPTSPRNTSNMDPHVLGGGQPRHVRPLQSPMYIPAVLRANDIPRRSTRVSPPTPPMTNSSGDSSSNMSPVARRVTGDSGRSGMSRISDSEIILAGLGEVKGPPTTSHWKSDSLAQICDSPICHQTFSLFTRRHHCRRCGNIFCDAHSSHTVPLDQGANYHPKGEDVRSCDFCFDEYQNWEDAIRSRSNSTDSTADGDRTPTIGCPRGKPIKGVFGRSIAESLGASAPNNWNWSTF